jgi:hypothetical protein
MNRANPLRPDSKAARSKIERERSVNVSGASVKNKVGVNRVAVSKADDKTGCWNKRAAGYSEFLESPAPVHRPLS